MSKQEGFPSQVVHIRKKSRKPKWIRNKIKSRRKELSKRFSKYQSKDLTYKKDGSGRLVAFIPDDKDQ